MKMRFRDLPVGSCFAHGKDYRKKVSDRKTSSVSGLSGKIRTQKVKGDPEVEHTACPVKLLGVGLRRHPEQVVEIGDGNLLKRAKGRK